MHTNTQYLIYFRMIFSCVFHFISRAKALSCVWDVVYCVQQDNCVRTVCISTHSIWYIRICCCFMIVMLFDKVVAQNTCLYICFCPIGAGETHSWYHWEEQSQDGAGCHEGIQSHSPHFPSMLGVDGPSRGSIWVCVTCGYSLSCCT